MSIPEWVTDLAIKCHKRWGTDTVDAWETALHRAELSEANAKKILNGFVPGAKATVADFGRAKARMFPPPTCESCANTGQLWDGEQYQYCGCDMGRHMAGLNRRIVERADAERPAWMMPSTRRLTVVE